MRLPVGWFEKRHAGDIWSRFGSVQQIQKTLTTSFIESILDGALMLLPLTMMLLYSVKLTLVALAAVAGYALLRWAFFRPLREASEEALVFEANQASHYQESLRGMLAIKLFNAQADRQSRFSSLVVDTMNAGIAIRKLELLFAVLHRLQFGLERVAVVWIGALLVMDQVKLNFSILSRRRKSLSSKVTLEELGACLGLLACLRVGHGMELSPLGILEMDLSLNIRLIVSKFVG